MTIFSFILCLVYTVYLLLGGVMFTYVEYEIREEIIVTDQPHWNRLKDLAINVESTSSTEFMELLIWLQKKCDSLPNHIAQSLTTTGNKPEVIEQIEITCPSLKYDAVKVTYHYPLSLLDSLYFSMTVITTIGYGHIYPTTQEGKVTCMLYSLIGIPLTLMLLARTSTFFGKRLYNLFTSRVDAAKQSSKIFIAIGTVFYILMGFVVFVFLPAVVFMYTEDWTYLDSVYYAYITLTTIGFGDLVTGKNMDDPWLTVYQMGVILWIIIGLGYWVMVANFIVLALKSKHMYSMAKRVAELKNIVTQLSGGKHDPEFINQSSKTSLNFLMQLASALAVPEMQNLPGGSNPESPSTEIPAPVLQRPSIPGIAALFNKSMNGGMPFFQNIPGAGMRNDQEQNKSPGVRKDVTTKPDNKLSKKEVSVAFDCNLGSTSIYPTSHLSDASGLLDENDISSCSLLTEVNNSKSDQQNFNPHNVS